MFILVKYFSCQLNLPQFTENTSVIIQNIKMFLQGDCNSSTVTIGAVCRICFGIVRFLVSLRTVEDSKPVTEESLGLPVEQCWNKINSTTSEHFDFCKIYSFNYKHF